MRRNVNGTRIFWTSYTSKVHFMAEVLLHMVNTPFLFRELFVDNFWLKIRNGDKGVLCRN